MTGEQNEAITSLIRDLEGHVHKAEIQWTLGDSKMVHIRQQQALLDIEALRHFIGATRQT